MIIKASWLSVRVAQMMKSWRKKLILDLYKLSCCALYSICNGKCQPDIGNDLKSNKYSALLLKY